MTRSAAWISVSCSLLLFSACKTTRQTVEGVNRRAPDNTRSTHSPNVDDGDIDPIISKPKNKEKAGGVTGSVIGTEVVVMKPVGTMTGETEKKETEGKKTEEVPPQQNSFAVKSWGQGLTKEILEILGAKAKATALDKGLDGNYVYGKCEPYKEKEGIYQGIQIEGGRLYGISLSYASASCEGKETGSARDTKSISFEDYHDFLWSKGIWSEIDAEQILLTIGGTEVPLTKVFSGGPQPKTPPSPVYKGLGLQKYVAEAMKGAPVDESLAADQDGTFASGCDKIPNKNEWRSTGIQVEGGRLHGIDLYFNNENCFDKSTSEGRDSKSFSLKDLKSAHLDAGIVISKDSQRFVLKFSSGASLILTKLAFAKNGPGPLQANIQTFGLGVSPAVRGALAGGGAETALDKKYDGVYLIGCAAFDSQWQSTGLLLRGGRLHGIDVYFNQQPCSGKVNDGANDSVSFAFSDYKSVLGNQGLKVLLADGEITIEDWMGKVTTLKKTAVTLPASND